jgi:hypothetical protein
MHWCLVGPPSWGALGLYWGVALGAACLGEGAARVLYRPYREVPCSKCRTR